MKEGDFANWAFSCEARLLFSLISMSFLVGIFSQMDAVGMPNGAKYEFLLFGKIA